jgi:6-pyruvoyltetrahydropterin/6-carboxytetrahydropterin synthase
MFRLRKAITLECAHRLPNHDGRCHNLHGHKYTVEVFIVGRSLVPCGHGHAKEGMLVDFTAVGAALKRLHGLLDHTFLNQSAPTLGVEVTTAEQLAYHIYRFLVAELEVTGNMPAYVEKVRVWETESGYAEYDAELKPWRPERHGSVPTDHTVSITSDMTQGKRILVALSTGPKTARELSAYVSVAGGLHRALHVLRDAGEVVKTGRGRRVQHRLA